MKGQEKILQLNSNLSKLIDSLCFQLSVNKPDENSLSLIEIIQWRNSGQTTQQQFKELYCGWLQSKNIYDLFTARQIQTYPKDKLVQFQGPIKKILNINEITKILQILNNAYNQIYIQKRVKTLASTSPKNQVRSIQQVQKLFSFLDSHGVINLRLSQLLFLAGSVLISENKPVPTDLQQFKEPFRRVLYQMGEIDGCVSLRSFKNYFLIQKGKPLFVQNVNKVLQQIQNFSHLQSQAKSKTNGLPNVFTESIQKWKSISKFKNQDKRVQLLKRMFQQNQRILLFSDQIQTSSIEDQLIRKYGKNLLNCLEIDQLLLSQFILILQDTVNKYLNIFQKIFPISNKKKLQFTQVINKSQNSQYINQSSNLCDFPGKIQNSTNKKKIQNPFQQSGSKKISKTAIKQRTPQKERKNKNEFRTSNNYRNRTPTHKNSSDIYAVHRQFGSEQKRVNVSGYGGTARQTTPTKSTLSFMTEAPRIYRAAQKIGLNQNNFYDKLFFFRNKRVESYQIVMKRLKNK